MMTRSEHEAYYQSLCNALAQHTSLSAIELLAITSNFLGKIIALQDQMKITPSDAMKIVSKNIEIGNQQVINDLLKTKGSA